MNPATDVLEDSDVEASVETSYSISVVIEGQVSEKNYTVASAEKAIEAVVEETFDVLDNGNRSSTQNGDIIDRVVNRVEDMIYENKTVVVEIADGYRLTIEPI